MMLDIYFAERLETISIVVVKKVRTLHHFLEPRLTFFGHFVSTLRLFTLARRLSYLNGTCLVEDCLITISHGLVCLHTRSSTTINSFPNQPFLDQSNSIPLPSLLVMQELSPLLPPLLTNPPLTRGEVTTLPLLLPVLTRPLLLVIRHVLLLPQLPPWSIPTMRIVLVGSSRLEWSEKTRRFGLLANWGSSVATIQLIRIPIDQSETPRIVEYLILFPHTTHFLQLSKP